MIASAVVVVPILTALAAREAARTHDPALLALLQVEVVVMIAVVGFIAAALLADAWRNR